MGESSPLLMVLAFATLGLLIAVTGGVAYLTTIEWRDRRRRETEEKKGNKPPSVRRKK